MKYDYVGDVADIQTGPFGSQLHQEDYVSLGTPIVTVEHLGQRKMTTQNLPYVSDNDKKRLYKYCLLEGDLVFSRVGSVDRCSYVSHEENDWMFSGRCLRVRCDCKKVYPLYLYYYFCLETTKQTVRNVAVGATMPSINTKLLFNIPFLFKPLSAQKNIADTLSCLDDKIELNNRINKNLEAQAQAIFKSWFVDFEPFQDGEFANSEFGRVPLAWNYGVLSSICEYSKRRIDVNSLDLTNYCSTENMLPNKLGVTTASGLPTTGQTTAYKKGDTLISNIRPYFKKIFYADMDGGCSPDVLCFVPTYDIYSLYLYQTLYSDTFFNFMIAGSKGTKMPRGDKRQIMQYPVVIPPENALNKFNSILTPMVKQISNNKRENIALIKLRDTLLPKLMSGEIQIPQEV